MTIKNDNEVHELFLNVRKSYRLLYLYQQRILDTVRFIGHKYGLSYDGGFPKFSDSCPRKGKGKLDNWAWDWLNMYKYSFEFTDGASIRLSLYIESDTGPRELDKENKINVDSFKTVENSESLVHFIVWDKSKIECKYPIYEFLYSKTDELKRKKGIVLDNNSIAGKSYPLTCFLNEDEASKIILDFSDMCEKKNFKGLSANRHLV